MRFALTDAAIFILSKNDKLKLLAAVCYTRLSKYGRSESKIWNIATRTTIIVAKNPIVADYRRENRWKKQGCHPSRIAPLADSPTSCPKSTDSKKPCHRRTTEHEQNRVANSSSLEVWRAVFQVIIGIFLRPSQTCK